jgi:hypothetical protein
MNSPGAWVRQFLLLALAAATGLAAELAHFITVDGTVDGTADGARLMDGEEEFRLVAFNVPTPGTRSR